jgi:glycolate oxidase
LLFPFADVETCINAADKIISAGFEPAVAEYMDTDIVEFSGNVTGNPVFPVEMDGDRVAATLMVTLEAEDDDAVMEKMEAIAELAEDLECLDILVGDTPTMIRDFWEAHDAFHTSMEGGAKCSGEINVTVPAQSVAELVDYAKSLAEGKDFRVLPYAHVGSGGVHIHVVSDSSKEEFTAQLKELADAIYAKVAQLGGDIGGEYGIGCGKLEAARANLSAEQQAAIKAQKQQLDPAGILNPGKVI